MVNFSLEGKVALVTGASYGIGFAIASAYAQAGATIVFNDIKQELVDKGLAAYEELGIKAHGYVCDVTDEEQVNALVAKIEKEVGVIDILVNNAGIIKRIPMCEMSAAEFRQVIDVDLNAPFIVSKAVAVVCESCAERNADVITLSNPTDAFRQDEACVIKRKDLCAENQKLVPVLKDKGGQYIPSQLDDLDGDGQWDELTFVRKYG